MEKTAKITWLLIAIAWVLMVLFSGCTTQKKAVNYFNKNAFEAAKYCATAFPVKSDSVFIPGKIVIKSDTVVKIGKNIPCPLIPGQTDTVFVNCPNYFYIRDTLLKTDTVRVVKENTAKDAIIAGLNDQNKKQKTLLKEYKFKANRRGWVIAGFIIGIILLLGGWIWFKARSGAIASILKKFK